jgi:indolepyruvate ferredoxin oxidoreductase alpha subunit
MPRQPAPELTVRDALSEPRSDFARVVLPPMSFARAGQDQEPLAGRGKIHPRARAQRNLRPDKAPLGIVVQGGMYNGVIRALQRLGLADIHGETEVPLYVLNVTYPLIEDEFLEFCAGKEHVLVVEEGQPEFIETGSSARSSTAPARM